MRIRPPVTDPIEQLCDEADTAFAVLYIGRDHGVTPQAMGCVDKILAMAEGLEGPTVDQIKSAFQSIKDHGDKVWENDSHLRECCVMVRDIVFREWKHDEWMEARESWVDGE